MRNGFITRKCVFSHANSEGPDQPAHAQTDQGHRCSPELLHSVECPDATVRMLRKDWFCLKLS